MKQRIPFLGLFLLLAGCASAAVDLPAASPTPTIASITRPEYLTIPAPVCLLQEQAVVRTSILQGDLLAWSPAAEEIAFLASTVRTNWNIGDLWIAPAGDPAAVRNLAENAVGGITWSPDGAYIVFTALRISDGLYTLQAVSREGDELIDFFPGTSAKTDSWASPKAVAEWLDTTRFRAVVSCGPVCSRSVELNIAEKTQGALGEPEDILFDYWTVHRNDLQPPPVPLEDALHPNWSPDGSRVAYFDRLDNAWVLDPRTETQFLLPLGTWDIPYETKWSPDGELLAVRAGGRLLIFAMDCGEH